MKKIKMNTPRLVGEVTSACLRYPTDSKWNWVYSWVEELDGPDQVASFILNEIPSYFKKGEWESFQEDMFKYDAARKIPWYWTRFYAPEYMESIKKIEDWVMLATDAEWRYIKDSNWYLMYKVWVNWDKFYSRDEIPVETKRVLWFYKKTVYVDKMVQLPKRYAAAKDIVIDSTKNLKLTTQLPADTIDAMIKWANKFFQDAESWKWKDDRWKKLYGLFSRDGTNFFKLMLLAYPDANRVLTERKFAQEFFGIALKFGNSKEDTIVWKHLQNAMYLSLGQGRWLNANVFDALPQEVKDMVYGEESMRLYENVWGKMVESDKPEYWIITAAYLQSLSPIQRHKQVAKIMEDIGMPFNARKAYAKIYLWNYPMAKVVRALKTFTSPQILSAFMSFSSGISGLMPLLALNSGMGLMQKFMSKKQIFEWDFNKFLEKFWYISEMPYSLGNESSLSVMAIKWANAISDAFNGWLYNVWDMIMSDSYRERQLALFFQAYFPWVSTVHELDYEFSKLSTVERERIMNLGRKYAESSSIDLSSNRTFRHSWLHLHTAEEERWQPWLDVWYLMASFFSSFWYNKAHGTWNILKKWFRNVFQWKIGAQYVDRLLAGWASAEEARSIAMKAFLENEEFAYTLDKLYRSFTLWKYWAKEKAKKEWEEVGIKELASDMLKFAEYFEGTIAAGKTLPDVGSFATAIESAVSAYNITSQDWIQKEDLSTITTHFTTRLMTEYARRLTRRLYPLRILLNAEWALSEHEEISLWQALIWAIQDTTTSYLYYMDDNLDKAWFEKNSIISWPYAIIDRYLGISNIEKEDISNIIRFTKDRWGLMALSEIKSSLLKREEIPEEASKKFFDWVKYRIPLLKDYYIGKISDIDPMADSLHEYLNSQLYKDLEKWILPKNMSDNDYYYLYWLATRAWIQDVEKYDKKTFKKDNTFKPDDWEIVLNRNAEIADDIDIGYFKKALSEEAYNKFMNLQDTLAKEAADSKRRASYFDKNAKPWQTYDPIYKKSDLELVRTLAFLESDAPWAGRVALSYLISQEAKKIRYPEWAKYAELPKEEDARLWREASIQAAKKYWAYIFDVDKHYSVPQLWMYLAKTRGYDVGKYISDPWDSLRKTLKFVREDWTTNAKLRSLYNLDMWNNIIATKNDIDVKKIATVYQERMNVYRFQDKGWNISPGDKKFLLNAFSATMKSIESLPIDDNVKRQAKIWVLLTVDPIFNEVKEDERFSKDAEVQTLLKDTAYFRHWITKEMADIVQEKAEDDAVNVVIKWLTKRAEAKIREDNRKNWKYNKSKWDKKYSLDKFLSWKNKMFPWFNKIYPYIRDRYYSHYFKYYDLDHWVNTKPVDYLKESEFKKAISRAPSHQSKKGLEDKKPGFNKQDWNGIWGYYKSGRAIPFYKWEDPDKNVEYNTPYRKRRVRRWSWQTPISITTWKRLTPTPKQWKKK